MSDILVGYCNLSPKQKQHFLFLTHLTRIVPSHVSFPLNTRAISPQLQSFGFILIRWPSEVIVFTMCKNEKKKSELHSAAKTRRRNRSSATYAKHCHQANWNFDESSSSLCRITQISSSLCSITQISSVRLCLFFCYKKPPIHSKPIIKSLIIFSTDHFTIFQMLLMVVVFFLLLKASSRSL